MSKLLEQIGDWGPAHQRIVEAHPGLYRQLVDFIQFHRDNYTVYPVKQEVFKAFELCQMKDLRVVIIGQDVFHNGSANGLSFGVKEASKIPASLKIIREEIFESHGEDRKDTSIEFDYSLSHLAKQGVLLLNTTLTVTKGRPNSHEQVWGWYTKEMVRAICESLDGVIFLLWGKFAQHAFGGIVKEVNNIHDKSHIIFASSHPAAEVYGSNARFLGCNHFLKVNEVIAEPIDWFKFPEKKETEIDNQFNLL